MVIIVISFTMSLSGIESLEQDTKIELFIIDQFNLRNPYEAFYFCNYSGITFEGNEYQGIGCEADGYDLIGQGSIANPNLAISNVGGIVSNLIDKLITTSGYRLEGARVTRINTSRKFLDGQSNAGDSIRQNQPDIYFIEQLVERTYNAVKFRLATPWDIEGETLPSRIALRSCGAVYRSPECSYLGSDMYTITNDRTLDPDKDVCSKTLRACKLRFGNSAVLPFSGYPGLGLQV